MEKTLNTRKVKHAMQVMTALIIILTVIAAIGTIVVGISPKEEANYGKKTKRNLTRLTLFYGISAILLAGIFFYFFE